VCWQDELQEMMTTGVQYDIVSKYWFNILKHIYLGLSSFAANTIGYELLSGMQWKVVGIYSLTIRSSHDTLQGSDFEFYYQKTGCISDVVKTAITSVI
jgi:hypothetical protein